ncbi:hypothetical protein IEQ_04863 [Bacillus cereus BAG6X1-2]|nr:hypothetical protein IEQ_04863 [Bacillus cereus BAG6X1-2]
MMKTKLDMSYDVIYENVINSGVTINMDDNATKVVGTFYNAGADEILKDIAVVYLRELQSEIARIEHNSKGLRETNESCSKKLICAPVKTYVICYRSMIMR